MCNDIGQFPNGNPSSGPNVDRLSDCIGNGRDEDKTPDGVLYKRKVPDRVKGTDHYLVRTERLGNDRRDNSSRGLPGTISIERPERCRWQAERTMIRFYKFVCPDLARRIGGLALERMFLIDRSVLGRSIDFGRRGMYDPLDALFETCLENIERSYGIRPDIGFRCDVGIRDANQRSEMKNNLLVFHRIPDVVGIDDISHDDPDRGIFLPIPVLQQSPFVPAVVVDEGGDFGPHADKLVHQVATNKSSGTRDEYSFSFEIHTHFPCVAISPISGQLISFTGY